MVAVGSLQPDLTASEVGGTICPRWAPRACSGAGLGTAQLIILCHLLSTRYRVRLTDPEAVRMALVSVAMPLNFRGTINRR